MARWVSDDRVRVLAHGLSAAALVLVPTLGPRLTGKGEGAEDYDTVITPPDYAFAIWGPIFAGCTLSAIQQAAPQRHTLPSNRRSGWPLAGAYCLNALWYIASESGQFRLTPLLLPSATGCAAVAYRRLQAETPEGATRLTLASTGLLLGWTSLASMINLVAIGRIAGLPANRRPIVALANAAVLGAATALVATIARSRAGFLPLAGAAIWGLGTTAATPQRPRSTRLSTACGALAIVGAAVARLALHTTRPSREP